MSGDGSANPFVELIVLCYSEELSLETHTKAMVDKIVSKQCTLLALIEALETKLTHTSVQDRVKAMDILAHVFKWLPKNFLTAQELSFIVEFLSDRLKDQHLVIPKTIKCTYFIIQFSNISTSAGPKLLMEILQETNLQSHIHITRQTVYQTVEYLLQTNMPGLKALSTDFLVYLLQAIEGEKDPRNLLLIFRMMPSIMDHFALGPFAEDMFEVLACYFPVDFSPTSNMGDDITREMLATSLHHCLSHTPLFSEWLIPLALEKLDSSLSDAKCDSLRLMTMCCDSFQANHLQPFLPQLWHSLRREIFMGGNESVENLATELIQSIFRVVAMDQVVLSSCYQIVVTELIHHLQEPEQRLIQPTWKLLTAISNACEITCRGIMTQCLSVIMDHVVKTPVQEERKRLLRILIDMFDAANRYNVMYSDISPNWKDMLTTWFSFLTNDDPEFTVLSLKILEKIMREKKGFSQQDRDLLQQYILMFLSKESISPNVLTALCDIAVLMVSEFPEEVMQCSIPKLLLLFKENEDKCTVSPITTLLVNSCVCNAEVFIDVAQFLLKNLILSSKSPSYLDAFSRIVEKLCKADTIAPSKQLMACLVSELNAFKTVHDFATSISQGCTEEMQVAYDKSVIVLRQIVCGCDTPIQQSIVDEFWKEIVQDSAFEDCLSKHPLSLLTVTLGALRPAVNLHRRSDLLHFLIDTALEVEKNCDLEMSNYSAELAACLLNKISEGTEFSTCISLLRGKLEKLLAICHGPDSFDLQTDVLKARKAITLMSWIIKALAMRGIKDLSTWVEELTNLLPNHHIGSMAAESFGTILSDDCPLLNPLFHCNYRFLYKQRIFEITVPKLVEGYQQTGALHSKANFIKALSFHLKHLPKEVVSMEINNVFPLLVGSLKLDTQFPDVIKSTLNAFTEILHNPNAQAQEKLKEHCFDLIPQLTILSCYQNSMDVRLMALQCLRKCIKCPSHVVLPFRQQVVDGLGKCLDDRKRLVRQEGRKTRNLWIMLGAPGGI